MKKNDRRVRSSRRTHQGRNKRQTRSLRERLQFETALADLSAALARASQEIERLRVELAHAARVSLVGHLTASLVHQLGQPLTAVLSNAEAAQRLLAATPGGENEEVRETLTDLVGSGRRAMEVVEHLRKFLHKGKMQREPVDINRLVKEVALVLRTEFAMRHIELATSLASKAPRIFADRVQLQQLLFNLLLNAIDAIGARTPQDGRIFLHTRLRRARVEIAVEDRGQGIDPAHLGSLFQPFFSTKSGGMGMGLTICANIVSAHGGTIQAENNPAGGATFRVSMPAIVKSRTSQGSSPTLRNRSVRRTDRRVHPDAGDRTTAAEFERGPAPTR